MRKTYVGLALCAIFGSHLALGLVQAEPCYQPSSHQKPCSDRSDMVSSCDTNQWDHSECTSKKLYTAPKDVPDGRVEADSGSTIADKFECVKVYACKWNADAPTCFENVDWDSVPWSMEDKIIVNHQVTCPGE